MDVARALLAVAPKAQGDLVDRLGEGVGPWRERHGFDGELAAAHILGTSQAIRRLGRIPFVTEDAGGADVDAGVLAKVRALLAKAESTTFEAEAQALTAKAHQLMVRHTIDEALVAGRHGGGEVTARRVFVDDPYRRAKYLLLSEVARASSCRALLSTTYGFATVFGHRTDLDGVELLYTSLLLQATGGVVHARPSSARAASSQVAAYRRSWLLAFATRVGERLEAASAETVAEARSELGDALLPVLAAREDAVERAMNEAAPHTTTMRVTASSGEGYAAGTAAGERASLDRSSPGSAAPAEPCPAAPRSLADLVRPAHGGRQRTPRAPTSRWPGLDAILAEHGRRRSDIELTVSPYFNPVDAATIGGYRERGVDRLVLLCFAVDVDGLRQELDELGALHAHV